MRVTEKALFFVIQGEIADQVKRLDVPDFAGFWECDLSRSHFTGQPPIAISLEIFHREPRFEMVRRRVYPAWSDKWSIALTTDGQAHHENQAGYESRTVMSWHNQVVVLTSEFCFGSINGWYESRFFMFPERDCFLVTERLRGLRADIDSAWCFRRCCPNGGLLP
jgi:hypothetical protein